MPLYFAYGSNMNIEAMKARCPASAVIGTARLARHRFVINQDGYATLVRDPKETVHGLLFDLAFSDVPALDRYEGLARGLYRKVIQPVLTAEGPRKALIYIGRSALPGQPKPGYLDEVLKAARAAHLPAPYIAKIAQTGQAARPTPQASPRKVATGIGVAGDPRRR
ncbi:MAG: gamma-glutamylcyclotransferase [Proteobacteria bacterium]|nr:gamma-glutamylcyclotransferase [Pseudomonadota bacterium]